MTELFKSDIGSFEYRDYNDKCGVLVLDAQRYQLFVNDRRIDLSVQELKMLATEIDKLLKNALT